MSKSMINVERFKAAIEAKRKGLTRSNFPVDLHTVEGIQLYASLWAFAGRASRYQYYSPEADALTYWFDVTDGDPTALLIAADYARERGYDVTVEIVDDQWGGNRKFSQVTITPTK